MDGISLPVIFINRLSHQQTTEIMEKLVMFFLNVMTLGVRSYEACKIWVQTCWDEVDASKKRKPYLETLNSGQVVKWFLTPLEMEFICEHGILKRVPETVKNYLLGKVMEANSSKVS